MAQKRMLSNKVTETDAFIDMPLSAQCLYFHLNMNADDDGVVANPRSVMRKIGANDGDMKILIQEKFVLIFENNKSIILIKHWLIHNTIRKDRYKPTNYVDEFKEISQKENGVYTKKDVGCQMVANCEPQIRLDKIRLDKINNNIVEEEIKAKPLSSKLDIDLIKNIIDYLNSRMKTNYKHTSKANQRVINARINEGYTFEDFKAVINNRIEEWAYTEMKQYIRPQTLFGTKFESYLNSCEKVIEVNEVKIEKKVTNEVDLELDDILSKFD